MSDFARLQRLAKSLIPNFGRDRSRHYDHDDARNIINDLGLQIPPPVLAFLVTSDTILEDFVTSLYELEAHLRKPVVTESATLDSAFMPQVYVEPHQVAFSVTHKGKEVIFAEYDLPPQVSLRGEA
ncbi:MAG: hypothetical protein D6722_26840 [Bacteroidetes bacterium]|nr:MAG: hypothetical protein D6722_26840 [Bacteroidota bacterium]